MSSSTIHPTPDAFGDEAQAEFEAEFHDGPPVMGVVILLAVFLAGMALGGWLAVFSR